MRDDAVRVLEENWTGHSTVPSRSLYPHQWSWDSAFIAIGLRHLSAGRARTELESLMRAQWPDGRIPHIAFAPSVPRDAYFPGPDFWQARSADGTETSGIVQPPIHALAAWLTHQADPAGSAGFLERIYPRLVAWHEYLRERRTLGDGGLVAIVHPWESGMDNSPAWDLPLQRVTPAPAGSFTRRDTDHAAGADRPTDLDYGRYVQLAATYRDHGYDDRETPQAFVVEDPCFNALLISSEHALAEIAEELGHDPAPHRQYAAALTGALVERLFEDGIFRSRDVLTGDLIPADTVAGLIPLVVPGLAVADELLATALGPRFRLGETRLVPSYSLTAADFDPGRYWRGPSWFNTAWLIHRGLVHLDQTGYAQALRADFLGLAESTNYAEYIDPFTAAPHGARSFSWTAALAIDLEAAG
ncbi:MGH1-like glycoside hydrolase domain-containing protein [Kribbella sp. NPDC051586]|uniref:MGH1-like glycoside hydrolase domain-containing protein n=1 Tax=Kribbella sp. NPDC051586 TaxID=3364118 RepID=UPI00379EB88D